MKLREFKVKYMTKLSLYNPKNEVEEKLKNEIVMKVWYMRKLFLPSLIKLLNSALNNENVSEGFKSIIRDMLEDVQNIT